MIIMNAEITTVKKKILRWLLDEKYDVKELDDKEKKYYFRFSVSRTSKGPGFLIVQPKYRSDSLVFLLPLIMGKKEKRAFETLSKEEREDLISKLRINVALSGTGSILNFHPNPKSFESIHLAKFVYYDGLSKDRFFEIIEVLLNLEAMVLFTFFKPLSKVST